MPTNNWMYWVKRTKKWEKNPKQTSVMNIDLYLKYIKYTPFLLTNKDVDIKSYYPWDLQIWPSSPNDYNPRSVWAVTRLSFLNLGVGKTLSGVWSQVVTSKTEYSFKQRFWVITGDSSQAKGISRPEHVFVWSFSFLFDLPSLIPFRFFSQFCFRAIFVGTRKASAVKASIVPVQRKDAHCFSHKLSIVLSGVKRRGPFCLNFLAVV